MDRERSSHGEVVAIRRAILLVRALRLDAFTGVAAGGLGGAAFDDVIAEITALPVAERAAALGDLIQSLVRLSSVLAVQAATLSKGTFTADKILDFAETGLTTSSLDIDDESEL